MSFDTTYLEAAHEHCFGNEREVRESERACCIACAMAFEAKLATEATRQHGDDLPTVYCPVCTFDTVVGDKSGYPVGDASFVAAMNQIYFTEPLGSDGAWKELLSAPNN